MSWNQEQGINEGVTLARVQKVHSEETTRAIPRAKELEEEYTSQQL